MKNLFLPFYFLAVHENEEALHHFDPSFFLRCFYVQAGDIILTMRAEENILKSLL